MTSIIGKLRLCLLALLPLIATPAEAATSWDRVQTGGGCYTPTVVFTVLCPFRRQRKKPGRRADAEQRQAYRWAIAQRPAAQAAWIGGGTNPPNDDLVGFPSGFYSSGDEAANAFASAKKASHYQK